MADILTSLTSLHDRLEKIGTDMNRETDLWRLERIERDKLGITDEREAYSHFIDFMKRHGFNY